MDKCLFAWTLTLCNRPKHCQFKSMFYAFHATASGKNTMFIGITDNRNHIPDILIDHQPSNYNSLIDPVIKKYYISLLLFTSSSCQYLGQKVL